jgi:glycosyltransferase involved in cell wall biosynthesis
MNIGIVTTWFERGAAYVSRQYRQVLERSHDVFIYARGATIEGPADRMTDDPRVTWGAQGVVPVATSIDLDDFRGWLENNRIDVVLFNEQHWWMPVLLCGGLPVKTGAYVDYYTAETVPFFGCYDFLICNTRRHHGVFRDHPQAWYMPWGTDLEVFQPRSFAPVDPGCVTFFHSAGMNPVRKGADLVLRAFSTLRGAARLVIHTQVSLAECLPDVTSLIRRLESDGTLAVREETVPAPGLYHLGDVLVYPSRLDGIGLTIAEALACGLPAIVSDNGPCNEFVNATCGRLARVATFRSREDGYYWPLGEVDEADLATQMQAYVDAGPAALPDFKRAARAHAALRLDWLKNAADLPLRLGEARKLPASSKAASFEQARQFERQRARRSVRFWCSYHFPRTVRASRRLYRSARSGE